MRYLSRTITRIGGRRLVLALGVLYVAIAVAFPLSSVVGDRSADEVLIVSLLVGASGLALFVGGYRLSETDIRSDLYRVVAEWCLRAIGVMVGILVFVAVIASLNDPLANFLVLPALASVAGLGMGYHDGRAETRAVDAEEYSRELEHYQAIVETVDDGIFVADGDDRFALVNDAYCEMTGYERGELLGSHTSLIVDEAATLADEIRRDLHAEGSGTRTYEAVMTTASGTEIEAEATMALLPAQDGGGRDRVAVVRDVTRRNERERQLECQNERLDSFASLLAHELRNPVNIGQIYSQRLPEAANPKAVEYVTEAFERIDDLIEVMLLVTRGREVVPEPSSVELALPVRDAWDGIETFDAILDVRTDRTIRVDDTYVQHLFRNLFENAIEHGGSDVTVTVGDLPTGFYVEDDGRGIEPDELETVFETGYTSASSDGGMGLGLAFVQQMADVYGWTCSVAESDAGGARFEFANVVEFENSTE